MRGLLGFNTGAKACLPTASTDVCQFAEITELSEESCSQGENAPSNAGFELS